MVKEKFLSNILISGCGISFSKQERPTWINVLKICGLNINDVSGPGISNDTILNALLFELDKDITITHVICQLTNTGKLDIEMNKDREPMMNNTDDYRRFTWNGLWPSSVSQKPDEKKLYYKLFHNKKIEIENLIIKLYLLQKLCTERNVELYVVQGYSIDWPQNSMLDKINFDKTYDIRSHYERHHSFKHHDNTNNNSVPCKLFQKHLAKKINDDFIKYTLDTRLGKFVW